MEKTCVAVIGMGYVGLPLALAFSAKGHKVLGVDNHNGRVESLRSGKSFLLEIKDSAVAEALDNGMEVGTSCKDIGDADLVIVAVPTPLDESGLQPDLTMVLSVAEEIRGVLKAGASVCLESTVAPGTTDGSFMSTLCATGLVPDHDFYLGYSPERINPGSTSNNFLDTPKLIAGISKHSLNALESFYSGVFESLVPVRGVREAEFAKLLENSYRLVNISLVNELAFAAASIGIDFAEVLRAASSKPFGFQPFQPSAGAGGHCIPVDPVYLLSELEASTGVPQEMLATAIRVNNAVAERFLDEIVGGKKAIQDKTVLVAGLTYKRGVADTRNAASLSILRRVMGVAASVAVFDEIQTTIEIDGFHHGSIDLDQRRAPFDITILLHDFPEELLSKLSISSKVIFSAVGFFGTFPSRRSRESEAQA